MIRRVGLMLVSILTTLGLCTFGVVPASAMSHLATPCSVPYGPPANPPMGMYCLNNGSTLGLYARQALADRNHNTRVPFPSRYAWSVTRYSNESYVVYIVRFDLIGHPGPPNSIYKFGITRVDPWQHRANIGRDKCDNPVTNCSIDWVGSARGWYTARYIEASLIQKYRKRHGVCPPGQRVSCK